MSKNIKKSKNLYTDDNPQYTLKGTGFKDKATAEKTLKLIKKRCLLYQFQVINTMYNRAKYHPHKNENMEKAMNIFKKWLDKNKNIKEKMKKEEYKFLKLEEINYWEKLAEIYNISHVARGIKEASRTDEGFLVVYRKLKGKKGKLCNIPVKKAKPDGLDWWIQRQNFIKARLGQIKKSNSNLFNKTGKYKDLPSKQHVVLIMNGYSPDEKKLKKSKKHFFK
jgi:hypothetical protein